MNFRKDLLYLWTIATHNQDGRSMRLPLWRILIFPILKLQSLRNQGRSLRSFGHWREMKPGFHRRHPEVMDTDHSLRSFASPSARRQHFLGEYQDMQQARS